MIRIRRMQHAPKRFSFIQPLLIWLTLAIGLMWLFQKQHTPQPEELLQAQPAHDHSYTQNLDGLGYLNYIRHQAGLPFLHYSPELTQAAGNHARYLTHYPNDGHDETQTQSPLFTGAELGDRVAHVGYAYQGAQENISTIQNSKGSPLPAPLPEHLHLDGLMTAIYHRFSLLDPSIDEAGVVMASSPQHQVLVVNQGSRIHQSLCRLGRQQPQVARTYTVGLCRDNSLIYQDEMPPRTNKAYVVYPVGDRARTDFHNEIPNPMPEHEFTGNPVSIMFADHSPAVTMRAFRLYQTNTEQEITSTHILTHQTDPNKLFTPHQFALFPLQPLQYDTPYRAEFHYRQQGQNKIATWQFRTKKPDYPYFSVQGGEKLAVESGKAYFVQWAGKPCRADCASVNYRARNHAELTLHGHEVDGLILSITGERGSSVRVMRGKQDEQAVTLYIQ